MSGFIEVREFPQSAFSYPKQGVKTLAQENGWKIKVPHKYAENTV